MEKTKENLFLVAQSVEARFVEFRQGVGESELPVAVIEAEREIKNVPGVERKVGGEFEDGIGVKEGSLEGLRVGLLGDKFSFIE